MSRLEHPSIEGRTACSFRLTHRRMPLVRRTCLLVLDSRSLYWNKNCKEIRCQFSVPLEPKIWTGVLPHTSVEMDNHLSYKENRIAAFLQVLQAQVLVETLSEAALVWVVRLLETKSIV